MQPFRRVREQRGREQRLFFCCGAVRLFMARRRRSLTSAIWSLSEENLTDGHRISADIDPLRTSAVSILAVMHNSSTLFPGISRSTDYRSSEARALALAKASPIGMRAAANLPLLLSFVRVQLASDEAKGR